MKQMTLAATKWFEKHSRTTCKAELLARMESLMPWAEFCALIEPHYPKAGNVRPPEGLERILRMYCIANWFNLSDVACEDALYDIPVFREFCRIDLGHERVPDATTLMNFRHLLETHQLGAALFAKVGQLLMTNGMKLSGGTIVDATLIAAPPSTKNQDKARDPEMHQTKKGNDSVPTVATCRCGWRIARTACRPRSPRRYRTSAPRSASPIRCAISSPSSVVRTVSRLRGSERSRHAAP